MLSRSCYPPGFPGVIIIIAITTVAAGLVQCLHPESCEPGSASPGFSPSPGDQALGVSAPFGSGVMEHFLLLAGTITGLTQLPHGGRMTENG